MKRLASWIVAAALTTLGTLAFAAPPASPSTRGPACTGKACTHDGPHQHGEDAPDGWRRAPSGILLPGVPPTVKEQIETYREMYIPGRQQPGTRIIVPGPPKLLVPAKPDTKLIVVKGASRDAMARALIE